MTRVLNPRVSQALVDATVVATGWTTALVLTNITDEFKRSNNRSLVMAVIALLTTLVIMQRRGLYAGRPTLPRTEEISRVFTSALAGASAVAVAAAFLDWHIGAWEIVLGWFLVFAGRMLVRGMARALMAEIPGAAMPESIVIVGTGDEARELAELIADHPESQFVVAGVIGNLSVAEKNGLLDLWIGPTERMIELMHQQGASGAIVTATGFRGDQFRSISKELFQAGHDVHISTGISRMGEGRFDVRSLAHEPLVVMERNSIHRHHRRLKRVIDLVGATVVLVLASPIMILTALLIWIEDRGPLFYTAPRAGRDGEFFSMYKFRSMVTDAEAQKQSMRKKNERTGPLFKISDDPRITRVGRFIRESSIDELPQLLNVLRGEMSLVGPRPALPEEEAAFDDELRDRFEVRPGITGLWQVEARSNAAFNAYRRLDLHYVENWNLALDLRILLATGEQIVVSLALLLLPLGLIRSRVQTDGITPAAGRERRGRGDDEDLLTAVRTEQVMAREPDPATMAPAARSRHLVTNGSNGNGNGNGNGDHGLDLRRAEEALLDLREQQSANGATAHAPDPVTRSHQG